MTDQIIDVRINLADYQPHPRNYNEHPDSQVAEIAESLRVFGQPRSIVVWRGFIIAGHGVVLAAQRLGWKQLDARRLPDDWPEHKALAYLAADNELARGGAPNLLALAKLAEEIRREDEALARLAAGGEESLKRLADLVSSSPLDGLVPENGRYREQYGVIVICEDERHQEMVYEDLKEAGYEVRVVVT